MIHDTVHRASITDAHGIRLTHDDQSRPRLDPASSLESRNEDLSRHVLRSQASYSITACPNSRCASECLSETRAADSESAKLLASKPLHWQLNSHLVPEPWAGSKRLGDGVQALGR